MITNMTTINCATPGQPVPSDDLGIPDELKVENRTPLSPEQEKRLGQVAKAAGALKEAALAPKGGKSGRLPVPGPKGGAKPIHAADAADLARIPQAVHFMASIFLGTGQFDKHQAATLEEARATGKRMTETHKNGRVALIYAIMPDGLSVLVPANYVPGAAPQAPKAVAPAKVKKKAANTPAPDAGKPAMDGPDLRKPGAKGAAKKSPAKTAKAKPAKKPAASSGERNRYDWTGAEDKAKAGTVPAAPDFSAATHERFRPLLAEVVKAARAGDIEALRKIKIAPTSSSPKAVDRYRGLCVKALKAKG